MANNSWYRQSDAPAASDRQESLNCTKILSPDQFCFHSNPQILNIPPHVVLKQYQRVMFDTKQPQENQ